MGGEALLLRASHSSLSALAADAVDGMRESPQRNIGALATVLLAFPGLDRCGFSHLARISSGQSNYF